MKILGVQVPFTAKAVSGLANITPTRDGGWYPLVREPWGGAWQRNIAINNDTAASFHADFACKTLIARDIAKLRVKLVEQDDQDIWTEIDNPAFSPVLRKPNDYQTRNQFFESWMLSKLSRGNTYVLKERDNRNVVTALHVLDPMRVQPLVAFDGSVFYRINSDYIAGVESEVTVPAREVIHDRMNCLFHPLIGTPPVFASGLASMLGINAQNAAALLFQNESVPGGLITVPGSVSPEMEQRAKEQWEMRFQGVNRGRVAVLTAGATYQTTTMTSTEAQMVDQLKWSAEVVASVYHVPPYKVGIGPLPTHASTTIQALNLEYYSQALQSHIEDMEEVLDQGLGIGTSMGIGTEFDTENLLRMDTLGMTAVIKDAVGAGVMSPNEGRSRFDLKPVDGGDSPYLQQQNFSLAALAKRDAQANPFAPAISSATASPSETPVQDSPAVPVTPSPTAIPGKSETLIDIADIAKMFTSELYSAAEMQYGP